MDVRRWSRVTVCALLVGGAVVAGGPVVQSVGIQARALSRVLADTQQQMSPSALLADQSRTRLVLGALASLQLAGIVAFEMWVYARRRQEFDPGRSEST